MNPSFGSEPNESFLGSNYDAQHRKVLRVDPSVPVIVLGPVEYDKFRLFVLERTGLDYPPDKSSQLTRGLGQVMQTLHFASLDQLYNALQLASSTSALWDELVSALTIGETYFFRNTNHFDALAKHILPDILKAREFTNRRLRIWSAGCATGEEPYSLAILIREMVPQPESWNISILATDINRESLAQAQRAIYGAWSFRGVDKSLQEKYFHPYGDRQYMLDESIKHMVQFDYLNLVSDAYPSLINNTNAMDIILCRNVTIYFSEDITRQVLKRFHQCLVDGGWFIPGPSEPNLLFYDAFEACTFPGAVVYRKSEAKRTAAAANTPAVKVAVRPTATTLPFPLSTPSAKFTPTASPFASKPRLPEKTVATKPAPPPLAIPTEPYSAAVALNEQGRAQEALAQLYRKLDQDPKFSPAYALMGRIYANQGRLEDAQHWCERAVQMDKLHPEPYYILSLIYQEHGMTDSAIDALKHAIYLDRDFIMGHYNLAMLYMQQKNRELAVKSLQNVQRLIQAQARDALIPEGDGLNAGRLGELVEMHLTQEA